MTSLTTQNHVEEGADQGMVRIDMNRKFDDAMDADRGRDRDGAVEDMMRDVLNPLHALDVGTVATLAGHDYRSRQNVKRKAARWGRIFSGLDPLERLTVLIAMAESSARGSDPSGGGPGCE